MRVESPDLKRCCFCVPLRRGLIGWGYARLALDILTISYIMFITVWIFALRVNWREKLFYMVLNAFFMTDIAFTVLLIVASHKKSARLLRISFNYNVVWLALVIALGVLQAYHQIRRGLQFGYLGSVLDLIINSSIIFAFIFLQVYLLLLTRSEAKKLQNQQLEIQFVNNEADGEARCVYTDKQNSAEHMDIDQQNIVQINA